MSTILTVAGLDAGSTILHQAEREAAASLDDLNQETLLGVGRKVGLYENVPN